MHIRAIVVLSVLSLAAVGCRTAAGETPSDKRRATQQMASDALATLYRVHPSARGAVESAYGYAVFSNLGTKIFVVSSGQGYGVARVNGGSDTYMRMAELGIGVGWGVKDFRAVFVFENRTVFDQFVNEGWSIGSEADAAAKVDETGGALAAAIEVAPGVYVYQLTETGLALQASVSGTKYWKDNELNIGSR